ncbi:MAG: UPF0182 family protein [Desulfotomaculaceae bacterium]|nr:UPF0182 family protein [Desulfotomaculaceae bacterium]
MQHNFRRVFNIALALVVVLVIVAISASRLYTDWLWFQSLTYQSVFMTIVVSDIGLRIVVGVVFFLILFINLFFTLGPLLKAAQNAAVFKEENVLTIQSSPWSQFLTKRILLIVFFALSLIMAFLFSLSVVGDWVTLQKFLHPTSFGNVDPVFQKDIGFYIFKVPFYEFLYDLASWAIIIVAFWVSMAYLLVNITQGKVGNLLSSISARYHLSFLAALFFGLKALGYQLDQYALLYTLNGAVWGPGYTATHATIVAYKVLMVIALLCALAIMVNLFLRRFRLVVYSIVVLVLASVFLGGIFPSLMQKFVVQPNEIVRESPYLERNIQYTRMAYNLDTVVKKDFPAGRILTADEIKSNKDTIDNIRLWDWAPLMQTYAQLQEMRLYYEFHDIDIDRYVVDGKYRQVMLGARELNQERLSSQAKTWINQRLIYTHGYGIAMSPVNSLSGEGLPTFFLKDIPPVTHTDLKVDRPELYYGEVADNYVIVNTATQEFNYPKGDENEYSTYEGESGVGIANFWRRCMFAFSLGDYKLLLSNEVDNDSRVLYYRNIKQRVAKVAPFLKLDNDPYIVLSEGKLYWMLDAYTITDRFPYSEPFDKVNNYIRNSVKIVVDAYSGKVDFYISDQNDPIVMTYSKIFPGMFKPLEDMSEDLRRHIRYPVDYFMIQANMYAVYHMEEPQVFYNREDKWNVATEITNQEEKTMEPYYTIIELPGKDEPEFVLILPFTPQNKKNMIAWFAANSDGEDYGKILAYSFPKQELVYGPTQVEARITQDAVISQQISLWDQRGSNVIRGNLLAIPINDALLYVEPLYLQAEQSKMPELRRVIVAHGDIVVMEPTLELALDRVFGSGLSAGTPDVLQPEPGTLQIEPNVAELAKKADQLYEEAQNKLKAGDWTGYGDALSRLKQTLSELVDKSEI